MTDIALGLVGYGKIARDQHLPALAALPGIRVVAVADPLKVKLPFIVLTLVSVLAPLPLNVRLE